VEREELAAKPPALDDSRRAPREGNKESPGQDTGYPGGPAKSLEEYGPNYGKTAQLRWSVPLSPPRCVNCPVSQAEALIIP